MIANSRIYQQGLYLNYCLWKTEICPKMVANSKCFHQRVSVLISVVLLSVGFEGERVLCEVVSLMKEYSECSFLTYKSSLKHYQSLS